MVNTVQSSPKVEPVKVSSEPCALCGYHRGMWRTVPTNREREVLALVAQGYGNKMVACELRLSTHTVKNVMTSITKKLGARDRTMAVMIALDKGWIKKVEEDNVPV